MSEVEKTFLFRAACGRDLKLRQGVDGNFTLVVGCEECGVQAGSALIDLWKACPKFSESKETVMANEGTVEVKLPPTSIAIPGRPAPSQQATPVPQEPPPAPASQESPPSTTEQPSTSGFGTPSTIASWGANLGLGIDQLGGEELVDVNAALEQIPELQGGPSTGGFSWHKLEPCGQCWRKVYLRHVLGLRPKRSSRALSFGSLYHACKELWYRTGGGKPYDLPCDVVRQAGAPRLAGEVQRLFYAELQRYAAEEAHTWDIRGVEVNAIFWMEPERINGKTVCIPLSCRHDLVLAKHKANEPCSPQGPVPHGVYVLDHKTTSAMTYDVTKGWGMDPQFLTNGLIFMRSGEAEIYGPLNGIIVAVAAKHKDPGDKSFFRVESPVDLGALEEFYRFEVRPLAIELYRRLESETIRGDRSKWPKNRSQCVGRYGCCDYFDLCDVGGDTLQDGLYNVDEKYIIRVDELAPPPPGMKKRPEWKVETDPEKKVAAEKKEKEKKSRVSRKRELKELLTKAIAAAAQEQEVFKKENYLVPDHTRPGVLKKLVANLSGAWPAGSQFPFGEDTAGNSYMLTITEKGIDWVKTSPEEKKQPSGKITFKAVAEAICADWWDLNKMSPPTASGPSEPPPPEVPAAA